MKTCRENTVFEKLRERDRRVREIILSHFHLKNKRAQINRRNQKKNSKINSVETVPLG